MTRSKYDVIIIGAGVAGLTCGNFYGRFARFKTPVRNLYQAGHYSIWPGGIAFSALSGKLVADGMYEGFAKTLLW